MNLIRKILHEAKELQQIKVTIDHSKTNEILFNLESDDDIMGYCYTKIYSLKEGFKWFKGLLSVEEYKSLFQKGNGSWAEIEKIKIHEEFRKGGYGRLLMNKVISLLSNRCSYLVLIVNPDAKTISLDKLIDFYKSFGFKKLNLINSSVIMYKEI